jgi:hypothetical protein
MVNPSKSVWIKSSKTHSKKKIRLKSTLSEGWGLENALERKEDLHRKRWSLKKKKNLLNWYGCTK